MKKIILFNGAPSSGKDIASQYLINNIPNSKLMKFAGVLKERTHALYGFSNRDMFYYESVKDKPSKDFLGLTPRQAYIEVSETYFKPTHGKRIFGEILAQEINNSEEDIIIISDSGFQEEVEVIESIFGAENILLLQPYRKDCDFSFDSRGYIELPNSDTHLIYNDGGPNYLKEVLDIVSSWIDEQGDFFFG